MFVERSYNPSPKMSEIQNLQFESSIPPTPSEIASFSRYLTPVPSKTSKIRRPQKVKFGPSCIVYLYNLNMMFETGLAL